MKIEQDFEVYLSTWMQLAEERLDAIEEKLGVSSDFGRKKTGEDNHYHQLMLARMKIHSLEKDKKSTNGYVVCEHNLMLAKRRIEVLEGKLEEANKENQGLSNQLKERWEQVDELMQKVDEQTVQLSRKHPETDHEMMKIKLGEAKNEIQRLRSLLLAQEAATMNQPEDAPPYKSRGVM